MDNYSAATSWVLFGAIVGVGVWYYYPRQQPRPSKSREDPQHAPVARRKRNEQDDRTKRDRSQTAAPGSAVDPRTANIKAPSRTSSNENLKKRKAPTSQSSGTSTYAQVVKADEPDEDEMSTKRWAEGMLKTQKGHEISSGKSKETRVRTVKQSSALHEPGVSSGSSQADDDMSPAQSPRLNGEVSDMLEPAAPGPSTLRLTAPTKPQKERAQGKPKEEIVESKKQRQNRKKVEERRQQRESEETERKKMQENQRRTAREARGEPARNGIAASKPPAVSAWASSTATNDAPVASSMITNQNAPLLDTFDADSISSSNGGMEASTGPTSTTSGGPAQWDQDLPSEEEQMAYAMKQSEDESGWTTVGQPKKPKKNAETPLAEPVLSSKTNLPTTKQATSSSKPKGFQALDVQYEQRTDADPNDASNWDA